MLDNKIKCFVSLELKRGNGLIMVEKRAETFLRARQRIIKMQNNKKNNKKNTAKEVANFLGTKRGAIDCFSVRVKKAERKSIMPQRLLIYRILANCDLESIAPYKDDSNFKEKGIYAVAKLPNIKALNPLEKESKKDKHHSLD